MPVRTDFYNLVCVIRFADLPGGVSIAGKRKAARMNSEAQSDFIFAI